VLHRFPSPELPPFAPFELEVPDGWEPGEAPGCLALFVDSAATGFRVNALVGADRVAAGTRLEDAAAATLEEAAGAFADFRVEQDKVAQISGRPATMRFQSYVLDGVEQRVLQLQTLFFAPDKGRRGTKDLFHVDGTCLAADAATYAPAFVALAHSFRFA
jgi:hypothetical protein